ncbi:hypothetical protein IHQ68_19830 [Chelatococcus sambhunathii]|uniref:Uncharacterized protein n=1 Tax=Chelatococcus sambhunathii TaxID=363953 RepID=A0ABU1DLI9_9HYPH|nr:hypothetical protein [Chelatococcus sambhunathii]MDR4308878.1 hypothetical protein [Chelatococcus sambhunathii]
MIRRRLVEFLAAAASCGALLGLIATIRRGYHAAPAVVASLLAALLALAAALAVHARKEAAGALVAVAGAFRALVGRVRRALT